MTFVIIGGGPTGGVGRDARRAGAWHTEGQLSGNRSCAGPDPLAGGAERILATFPPDLSAQAAADLRRLGVTVRTRTLVTEVRDSAVTTRSGDATETIQTSTILWTAGVKSSPLGEALAKAPTLHSIVPGVSRWPGPHHSRASRYFRDRRSGACHPARWHTAARPASVAIQEGRYVGKAIRQRLQGKTPLAFHHRKGNLAIIGRHAGLADLGRWHLHGFVAWLAWLFVHIYYLIGFDNKLLVLLQWGWNYVTRKRGAQLITGRELR